MTWNDFRHAPRWVVASLLLVAACTEVQYAREGEAAAAESTLPLERRVTYRIERAFYTDPPSCAIVMPVKWPNGDPRKARLVEAAFGRHLSGKVDHVVGPLARERVVRESALDLDRESGRRRLAAAFRCDVLVEGETSEAASTFALIWAQIRFGVTISMRRASDGRRLWRGSHMASRSAGSLPFSISSVPAGAFSAGRLMKDGDVFPSMVDDVVRRVMASLPDTRRSR